MKTLRHFAIIGMAPFIALGAILFCGTGSGDSLPLGLLIGYLLLTFAADILLSRWQLHLNEEPEPLAAFMKRFAVCVAEKAALLLFFYHASGLLPSGTLDLMTFAVTLFILLIVMALSAVIMMIAGVVRAGKTAETAGTSAHTAGRFEKLRNFAACGMLAVWGVVMLLTEQGFFAEFHLLVFIIGLIAAVVLTFTINYLLSDWQLHLWNGETEGFAAFGKRTLLYLAEQIAVAVIALKIDTAFTTHPMAERAFSFSWLCFVSAMAVSALVVMGKGMMQNSKKAVSTAA